MTAYQRVLAEISSTPRTWLVTGAAGFIGSHLVEQLLRSGQSVVGADNFATGYRENLVAVRTMVGESQWENFSFHEGSVEDREFSERICNGIDVVLHQAALGSVPRSISDPSSSFVANVNGAFTLLEAARQLGVKRFVYASSSSVYGSDERLPKVESQIGDPLSPYAATKSVNEIFARLYARCYGMTTVGLRYFNVFGPRQDPNGPYAAVIPRWIRALIDGGQCEIFGDGSTSRDFCPVANVVQANILAGAQEKVDTAVFNVALGGTTSLVQLHGFLVEALTQKGRRPVHVEPKFREFRAGDIKHSQADISAIKGALGYEPAVGVLEGLKLTVESFV